MTAKSKVSPGKHIEVGGYVLSLLQSLAGGEQPEYGETTAKYAQRHLANLQDLGFIESVRSLTPAHAAVIDMQAACTERMRQLEPNGYPEKAVRA